MDGQRILKLLAQTSCAPRTNRRRNFFTTGNGSRRRGNPEPLAKGETPEPPGKGRASGHWQEDFRSHPATGNPRARGHEGDPEPPAQGKLCATRRGGNPEPPGNGHLRAFGLGEIRSHPATGHLGPPARGDSEPPGEGATPSHPVTGISGPSGPARSGATPATGHLRPLAWGDSEPPGNGAAQVHGLEGPRSHPAKGKPRATGQRRYSEPPAKRNSAASARGQPRAVGNGKTLTHPARGNSRAAGDPGNRNAGEGYGPGRRSSGAKDAEQSAGRRRETGRGPSISYMEGPCPIVPDPSKSRSQRHAAGKSSHSRGLRHALESPPRHRMPITANIRRAPGDGQPEGAAAGYPIGGRPTASSPACHAAATSGTPGR